MQLLKLSTAATVIVGPVLDADGAAVTTATVTNFSIAKNGTVAALTTETVTHSVNGYYTIALTATNTNTLGRLDVITNNSAMSMANHRYNVLPADTYEELLTTGIADAVLGTNAPANWINAASIAASALNGKGDWNIGKTGYSLSSTQSFNLTGNITGNLSGSVGSVTNTVSIGSASINSIADQVRSEIFGQEIESNLSMLQAQRLQSAILGALISGAGSGTEVFKAARNAATTRVTVTVDQSGNRTNIAYNLD